MDLELAAALETQIAAIATGIAVAAPGAPAAETVPTGEEPCPAWLAQDVEIGVRLMR